MNKPIIKTASDLKFYVNARSDSHFFDRSSMKFFGDTMANYGVRLVTIKTHYDEQGNYTNEQGIEIQVYELYRKKPVKHGLKGSAYFNTVNFSRVFPAK